MTMKLSMPAVTELKPKITGLGVGGAGGNAVNNMINAQLGGVEFVVANTDAQALAQALTDRCIQMGPNVTQGLGAGSNPDVGRKAAEESIDELLESFSSSNKRFIKAGVGGGTSLRRSGDGGRRRLGGPARRHARLSGGA